MHPFQPKSVRLDLFGLPDDDRPPDTPQWCSLPDRSRRRATDPMARMLLEHRGNQAGEAEAGPGETHRGGESSDV